MQQPYASQIVATMTSAGGMWATGCAVCCERLVLVPGGSGELLPSFGCRRCMCTCCLCLLQSAVGVMHPMPVRVCVFML
jgi:hypothetical protein